MGVQSVFTKLILIVLLGTVLRLWGLTQVPPSMNWDEISHGYTAYSLLKTGKDQWGQILPVFNFRGYGDYPTTLTVYQTVPSLALIGNTDLALRIPQAIFGILTIIAAFVAGISWKRNTWIGLLTALLIAIEPWSLFPSRAVFQSNSTVLLLTLFLAYYFRSRYLPSVLLLGLSLFSYHNARIFVPLVSIGLFLHTKKKAFLVVSALGLAILFSPASRARSNWVGILDTGAIAYLEEQRNKGGSPFVYNRPLYVVTRIAKNYLGYFSPQFLFFEGGSQYQFSVPGWGVLNIANLPFFYLGLVLLLFISPIVFILFIVSPLPAAITTDQFAVIRATTMLPLVQMISALGLVWTISHLSKKLQVVSVVFYLVIIFAGLGLYFQDYFVDYSKKYSQSWQYGHQQTVEFIRENYSSYDQIVFTKKYGEPHQYVLWYWPWDPNNYSPDWDYHDNWYWVNGFDKFKFVNDWEMKEQDFRPNTLIIASPENIPEGEIIKSIDFLAGGRAFVILKK